MAGLTDDDRDWAFSAPWSNEELEAARKISVSLKRDLTEGRAIELATYGQLASQLTPGETQYMDASRLRVLRRAEGLAKGWIKDGVE